MYSFMVKLFSDHGDGIIFECFSVWHWLYVFLVVALLVGSVLLLKGKSDAEKRKTTNRFIHIVMGLYVADFFLMPFALGEIDIDKLPFHSCTAMCVMCFWSNHNRFLEKYRVHFALLGAISNLMYLAYPSGVMSYETHPFSYRAVQTLLFHSLMIVYGFLVVIFDERGLQIKKCYRDALLLVCMTGWAFVGNHLYSGETETYSHRFNWFFIRRDPFDLLPKGIAPYLAPLINFAAFFAVELLVYVLYARIKAWLCTREAKHRSCRQEA